MPGPPMPIPATWQQIPITGTYVGFDGQPVVGYIEFNSAQYNVISATTIVPQRKIVELVNGSIPAGFTLGSTNDPDLSITGWAYTVTELFENGREYAIFVPYNAASVDMATAAPVVPPPALVSLIGPPGSGFTRTSTVATTATLTPDASNYDLYFVTAQAGPLTIANPLGLSDQSKRLLILVRDNGTSRAIIYGSQYRAIAAAFPVITIPTKALYLGLLYNPVDVKWDLLAVTTQP